MKGLLFILLVACGAKAAQAADVVPCENMLRDLRAAVKTANLSNIDKSKVADLQTRGIERCKADDDAGADDLFKQALALTESSEKPDTAKVIVMQMVSRHQPALSNKVPRVTIDFWLIKLLAVTVGETAADYMNLDLDLGLSLTSWLLSGILAVSLAVQFWQRRYVPWVYWTSVVLISVVGTLVTDNLVDGYGVPLVTNTIVFTIALALTFALWFAIERTLSIHTIVTRRRETFYWLAILFTFALGTSAGDWLAEGFKLGYLETGLIFVGIIALVAVGYYVFEMNAVLSFWLAYIFTRPVGASLGDLFSQPSEYGGLGFGTTATSYIFLGGIAVIVIYMSLTHNGDDAAAARSDPM